VSHILGHSELLLQEQRYCGWSLFEHNRYDGLGGHSRLDRDNDYRQPVLVGDLEVKVHCNDNQR